MTSMSKSLVQTQEVELAETKVKNQELMKDLEETKQKLSDSEIECPKKTMVTVEANKQRWDQETAQKIEEILKEAGERMQKANVEYDAKLKKSHDEITMLEAQVNGFANTYEESAIQVQSLSIKASSKINKLVEGLNNETNTAVSEVKKTKKHQEKIDSLVKDIEVQKIEIDQLTKKAYKAEFLRQETQTKLDSETKLKQSLADDF